MEKEKKPEKEPCYFCNETEDGCNRGQHCSRYHRKLTQDEKKRYFCGSTKHLVDKCDRPKKEDRLPTKGTSKGEKGKSGKGKYKGKREDSGKGNGIPTTPKVNPEEITPKPAESKSEETLEQEQKPEEQILDSKNKLSEFEKRVIKALKDEQQLTEEQKIKK